MQIPGISSSINVHAAATFSSLLSMTNVGIPLTGSMSAGLLLDLSKHDMRSDRINGFLCH